ncbi:MAG: hypothetical protein NC347_09620 [Clostridium sp.]|nr:hypothetical protein [Clostridium sp.]
MAKKNSTLGKLLALTTAVAAIGGTCYIFRDKIKTCPLYQKASDKLCNLKNSISDKFGDNDDFCFDDDDFDNTSDDVFADNEHGREYTSIAINAKEQNTDSATPEDTDSSDTAEAQTPAENSENTDTAEAQTPAESLENTDTAEAPASVWNTETTDNTEAQTSSLNTETPDITGFHTVGDSPEVSNDNSDKEEDILPKEDMTEITNDTNAAEQEDSALPAEESDIPASEDVIPTISFDNPFNSTGIFSEDKAKENAATAEVTGYENEGLSDVSEDPDVLEEQDKLDF